MTTQLERMRAALAFARTVIQPDWENAAGQNAPMRKWCAETDRLLAEPIPQAEPNDSELLDFVIQNYDRIDLLQSTEEDYGLGKEIARVELYSRTDSHQATTAWLDSPRAAIKAAMKGEFK